jgi:subtilisin family serine protease
LALPLFQTSDVPVNPVYISNLKNAGYQVTATSKWLNAAVIRDNLDKKEVDELIREPYIIDIQKARNQTSVVFKQKKRRYSFSLEQVNGNAFKAANLNAKGIRVGIIDGGFLDADKNKTLAHFFPKNVLGYRDFLEDATPPYGGNIFQGDDHGTTVWKNLGGYDSSLNIQYGIATEALYFLARTDHGIREFRGEEEYWVSALEWMDSCGVRIINSSVGYNYGFDDPKENYEIPDMDGNTAMVSRALQLAAEEKGILVVVAAGNDGDNAWKVVSAPADAEASLAVGATNYDHWSKANYSSSGAEFLDYIKPDIACFAANGTSFSAPVITGIAAAMLQEKPDLSYSEIKELIMQSAHLYPYKNNFIGYGVPDCGRILELMNGKISERKKPFRIRKKYVIDTTGFQTKFLVIHHKNSDQMVIKEEVRRTKDSSVSIEKPENAFYSTISSPHKTIEIIWK